MSDRKATVLRCIIGTCLIFHYAACFTFFVSKFRWIYGSTYPEPDQNCWFYNMGITVDTPLYTIYVKALYRGVAALLAIKRGRRYRPNRVWEEALAESTMNILGKFVMGLITVILLEIFLTKNKREREYQETMAQIAGYMRRKNVPEAMQKRIIHYYEYRFNRMVFRETDIQDTLSGMLMKQFHLHDIARLIRSVSFFEKLDQVTLDCIAKKLKSEYFLEKDVIVKAGEPGDCMYFILNGTVAVFTPAGEEICHLQDGTYFGEICLVLEGMTRTATVVSIERCTLYRLDRRVLRTCIKNKTMLAELEVVALKRQAEVEEMMSTATAAKLELMHHA